MKKENTNEYHGNDKHMNTQFQEIEIEIVTTTITTNK